MPVDPVSLAALIRRSLLLTESERSAWISKLGKMDDAQMERLQGILEQGEKLNWAEELPKYEAAVEKAEAVVHSLTHSVHPSSPLV